ncbi:ABC transporter permease [Inquilinus sp. NPDC058860]|uniref:ABC transporter permease n=1 Tax=Inquilinus sp. NPDC058860 TaxID=3346652 RepID=UPI0036A8FDFB
MAAQIVRRLAQALLVMLAMSLLVFLGVFAIGNPVDVLIAPDATQEMRAQIIAYYGFDLPLWQQYLGFLGRVIHGDLGRSFVYDIPVMRLILERLPATLELTLTAMLVAALAGVPLGMYAGYRPESRVARSLMAVSILGFSVPTFWVGLVLILTFSVWLGWLPAGGRGETVGVFGVQFSVFTGDGLAHLVLPALNLALFKMSLLIRLARSGTREIMLSDTVKFARAAGLSEWAVMRYHVLRLIAIPIVTVMGLEFGSTLAFAVVTETIFSWPGLGKLIIESISSLDRPVMVAYLVLVALLFITINLVVDLTYAVLDPRLRKGRGG